VYVQSKAAGERVMASLERFLRERLRLKVNRDKSTVARPWERKFLGYTVTSNLQPKLKVAVQSIQRLRSKLRPIWRQGRGRKLASTIKELNPIIRRVGGLLSNGDRDRESSGSGRLDSSKIALPRVATMENAKHPVQEASGAWGKCRQGACGSHELSWPLVECRINPYEPRSPE
jgi:hypothetical protein